MKDYSPWPIGLAYDPEIELPEDGERVLVYAGKWPHGEDGKFRVCKFKRGISIAHRENMAKGAEPNPIEMTSLGPIRRSKLYHSEDEWSNNKKPYIWDWPPGNYFGHQVTLWWRLPQILKQE